MFLERGGGSITLSYERDSGEAATSVIFGIGMIGLGAVLLFIVGRSVFASSAHTSGSGTFFVFAVAGVVFWVAYTTLVEPNRRDTVFDHASRMVSQKQWGFINKELGPVSFDQIAQLYCKEAFVHKRRCLVAQLDFVGGAGWQLGYEILGLGGSVSASEMPSLLDQVRDATEVGFKAM
jgi:hypothetical protein